MLALVASILLLSAAPVAAEEPDLDWAYALAHKVMSPFCPGRTLAECPSPQAAELRMWILAQAAAGASEAEIFEMLVERFGDEVRGTPKPEGWGLSAYALPIVFFIIGAPVVVVILRRMSRGSVESEIGTPVAVTSPASFDPELERELERELGES